MTVCVDRNITTPFDTVVTFIPMMSSAQGNRGNRNKGEKRESKVVTFSMSQKY